MKEIIILAILSGLLFICFLIFIVIGFIQKKKKLIVIGLAACLICIVTTSYTCYTFVTKSYNNLTEILRPRTGEEIYMALFDKPQNACLNVLNYQDQIVPKIDYAIWLHFKTCPDELNRILSQHPFDKNITSTKGMTTTGPLANDHWFKPEQLGDSILIYVYKKDAFGNGQTIYTNLVHTEAYCIDILD